MTLSNRAAASRASSTRFTPNKQQGGAGEGRQPLAPAEPVDVGQGRGIAPAPPQQQERGDVEEARAEQSDRDQPAFAEAVEQGVDQAAAAEIADDLEAHRVAEESERLIFGDHDRDRAAADEEDEVEMEQPGVRLAAVQPADQPVEQPEDERLAAQQGDREGGDLERRIDRLRLAEAAAEQPIFAVGQRQLGEEGEEEDERQGQPRAPARDRRQRAGGAGKAVSTCIAPALAPRA